MFSNDSHTYFLFVLLQTCVVGINAYSQSPVLKGISIAGDSVYAFSLGGNAVRKKPQQEKLYYCFENFRVVAQPGARSRSYLHGDFENRSKTTNKLYAQGKFRYGLKHGEWRIWNADGSLRAIERWEKGQLKKQVLTDESTLQSKKKRKNKNKAEVLREDSPQIQVETPNSDIKKSKKRRERKN